MTLAEQIRATEKHLFLLLTRRRAELDVKIARLHLELSEDQNTGIRQEGK